MQVELVINGTLGKRLVRKQLLSQSLGIRSNAAEDGQGIAVLAVIVLFGTVGIMGFDPAVFVDDDGKVYGYWGFRRSEAGELDPETMATLRPGTEPVMDMVSGVDQEGVFRFFEASSIRKIKDKYVFVYSRWKAAGREIPPKRPCWASTVSSGTMA